MKKKIPKWLGKVGAIIGIVAVIVSSMILPASAAVIGPIQSVPFEAFNGVTYIDMYGVRNGYGDNISPANIRFFAPDSFLISPTATGNYTKYAPMSVLDTSAGSVYTDRVEIQNIGSKTTLPDKYQCWTTRTTYKFHNKSNTNTSNYNPSSLFDSISFTIEEAFLTKGLRETIDANHNSTTYTGRWLPIIRTFVSTGVTEEIQVKISYDVLQFVDGQIITKHVRYDDENQFADIGENTGPLVIDLCDQLTEYDWDVSYTFADGQTLSWYKNIVVEFSPVDNNGLSFIDLEIENHNYCGQYTPRDQFFDEVKTIQNFKIVDNTVDADFSEWLVTAIGGFMDFELFPGFSLSNIFVVVVSIVLIIAFLKLFAGG